MRQGFSAPYFILSDTDGAGDAIAPEKNVLLVSDVGKNRLPTVHTFDARVSKNITYRAPEREPRPGHLQPVQLRPRCSAATTTWPPTGSTRCGRSSTRGSSASASASVSSLHGGLRPPDPPCWLARGGPPPRSARQAHSLPLVRVLRPSIVTVVSQAAGRFARQWKPKLAMGVIRLRSGILSPQGQSRTAVHHPFGRRLGHAQPTCQPAAHLIHQPGAFVTNCVRSRLTSRLALGFVADRALPAYGKPQPTPHRKTSRVGFAFPRPEAERGAAASLRRARTRPRLYRGRYFNMPLTRAIS